jgi:hypothetical protein
MRHDGANFREEKPGRYKNKSIEMAPERVAESAL